jgi:16S rRNA (uracil1498-N3)-methyltransferase
MPRLYCPLPLVCGGTLDLPAAAARHVQVLRLQPGDTVTLFNFGAGWDGPMQSPGGEFSATVIAMGRSSVQVRVDTHHAIERQAARVVHLAVCMPANERMDWLVEKATELGVASIQPLMSERSVLRLSGERATKKQQHWHSVAVSACEQCGGNRVPVVHPVASLAAWLKTGATQDLSSQRLLLALHDSARPLREATHAAQGGVMLLSGPEGGLSRAEEAVAMDCGFAPVSLGARVLRAETAALVGLALLI